MNKKLSFTEILLHILFCVLVVVFFRLHSYLRPAALGALYKEYISACFVLFVCYLNYLILYPRLYLERLLTKYIISALVCLIVATLAEQILVHNQIYEIVKDLGLNLRRYFTTQTIMIFFRNSCFFIFSFMISTISFLLTEKDDISSCLRKENHLIVAKNFQKETVTLSISDISYCRQVENYAYLYLSNGKCYYRNCTMNVLADDIGASNSVRISRNIIVMHEYVQSFDQNSVYVRAYDGIKGFQITDYYKEQAIVQLKKHCLSEDKVSTECPCSNGTREIGDIQKLEVSAKTEIDSQSVTVASPDDKSNSHNLLTFIQSHPDCKGSDITDHFHTSLSTVNRILAQLKEEGLIEYVGSKKTGGYRVKS